MAGGYLAALAGGMAVSETLDAVPTRVSMPATSGNATPKATRDGKAANPAPTARQSLTTSALIVVGALALLVLADRGLKNARVA